MFLDLNEEQRLIQDTARQFAAAELAPAAPLLDQGGDRQIFFDHLKTLAELGFMGLNVREEYGGAEAGVVAFSVALTEIARACASTAVTLSVNNMVCEVIQAVGSEEQRRKYIPRICSGEYCRRRLRPHRGRGRLRPGGDDDHRRCATATTWILNGAKIFITSAPYAGVFVVWAVTDREAPKGKGISCFLVEAGTPGLVIGRAEEKMGQHASATHEVSFRGLPHSRLRPDGEAQRRLPGSRGGAGRRPHRHRFPGSRGRAGGDGLRRPLRPGAQAVRPAHRRLPGDPVENRRRLLPSWRPPGCC